jgi:hypothetical protein
MSGVTKRTEFTSIRSFKPLFSAKKSLKDLR